MSKNKFFLFIPVVFLALFCIFSSANAMTPTLSVLSTGSGDSVQINVNGDPNTGVLLFAGSQTVLLGNTNSSGIFSTVISSATYNISSNAVVYVKTGGINGSQSSSTNWPYISGTSTASNLTLSQNGGVSTSTLALLLNAGQTSVVTASANYLYVLSNTNPAIANINLNANQITVTANTYGSTVTNVCIVGSTTNCASITITVQNSGAQQLTFSQNNFSIYSGQSVAVTITGGSGVYTISNNSNSTAVQANLSGSTVTLIANGGVSSGSGSASITICTTDMNYCGIINVNASAVNSTAVTLSQTNPVVQLSQSTTVTIYGGTGSNFYVASNSNPSIVQANINSNILTLIANASVGTSTISICAFAGSCASLTANVSNTSSGNLLSLSQTSISILAGQSSNITISGGSTPYNVSSSSSGNIFNGVVNGNILTIYGVNPGTATANVCSSVGCTNLSITVNNVVSSTTPPTFSQNNILMTTGQQTTVYVSGNGGYYVGNNTGVSVASASIASSAVTISAMSAGSANISICQTGGQCSILYLTISSPATPVTPTVLTTPINTVAPAVTPSYIFTLSLKYGDKGKDVLELQKALVKLGFLSATPNGNYGPATRSAVKKFQVENNVLQTGNVGPYTRDALNKALLAVPTLVITPTTDTGKEQQIAILQQALNELLAKVAQLKK